MRTEVGMVGRDQSRKGHKVRTYLQDQRRHSGILSSGVIWKNWLGRPEYT